METAELLKDKETYNPSKLSDKILLDDHRIIHDWWSIILNKKTIKGWSKEDVYNAHKLIVTEIKKRDIEHNTPLPSTLQYDQPIKSYDVDEINKGNKIYLPQVLKAFDNDFIIAEDFISITGGLCNHGSTKGDIDVLIKSPEPKKNSPLGMATKFKLTRTLAKIGIPERRLQFLYDNFSSNNISHVNLYDLVLRLKPKRDLHEMGEELENVITPFSFVIQPKPLHGRFKEELYSPDTVTEVIEGLRTWKDTLETGIFVEKKFNGTRCQIHKNEEKIKIWTGDRLDITNKLPSLLSMLKKINHNFVVEGTLELWKDGKHQNKTNTATTFNEEGISTEEPGLIFNLYDLLWIDGKDIHSLGFNERSAILRGKFSNSKQIKLSIPKLVKSLDDLKSEVIEASKLPGSEGAVIKMSNYKYPLKPYTSQLIKFKNEFSMNVQVLEVHDVEGSKSKSYLTAIKDGQKLTPTGKTYNTNIQAKVGDSIRVVFVELSKYIDTNTKEIWYNFWSPRVIEKSSSADSIKTADTLVEKSGGQIAEKVCPSRYKNLLEEESYIKEFINNALLWETEEFDFALKQGWISDHPISLIPGTLAMGGAEEIKNDDNFLLKKQMLNKAIICLRDDNNKIATEKTVSLLEV